ncbi:transcriptional regulator, LacI family [Granulicella rosea]|uniref:Transcriptional regulator, LacI family n=1 Tax=Granulicella rosea TaxID=474952 RepID=A0A239M7B1_9BACT|nr:LacI family DNA-binding transcriptional regulator [Granulicella rosea]SNT37739.1 transcriptional regulator, LacI family [Granulicella rosea]
MKKRSTVIDVARMANVGPSTVSRFLRGVKVKPEIARRVAQAVETLRYEPDQTARALRVGRSRTIGVILPKVSNVFFSQSVQTIEEEARKRGCAVILLTHQDSLHQQAEHLATLRRYRVDGVLIAATARTTRQDIESAIHSVPVVAFDSFFSDEVDAVLLRNREAGRVATEHLLRHGYANVTCVTAKPEIYSFKERIAGYIEALAAHQLAPQLITAPDYEQLKFVLAAAIRSRNRPAAILSLSDFATLTIFTTFSELGMKPADAVPLIGFDDFGFASLIDPPLTVIRQPIESMVRYAMSLLFSRIDGEMDAARQTILLPGDLICRKSCGCV